MFCRTWPKQMDAGEARATTSISPLVILDSEVSLASAECVFYQEEGLERMSFGRERFWTSV